MKTQKPHSSGWGMKYNPATESIVAHWLDCPECWARRLKVMVLTGWRP